MKSYTKYVPAAVLVAAVVAVAAIPPARSAVWNLLAGGTQGADADTYYTCPMHPQIRLPQTGECPICGMSLVAKAAGSSEAAGTVTLTPRQTQLAGTRTEKVIHRPLVGTIDTVGRIDYDERRLARVTAWVDGRIDALHVNFTGVTIGKGHPLADLYSPTLISAQEEYIQAIRTADAVKTSTIPGTIDNARRLVESTRQRLLRWGLTEAQVDDIAAKKEIRSHVTLYAPIGGTVIQKHVVQGQYVKTGDTLFQIADLSKVWMYADIYESEVPLLMRERPEDYYACPMHPEIRGKEGKHCSKCEMPLLRNSPRIRVEITTQAYPGETFTGRIEFTDPFVNPRTRTVRIRCTIDNADLRLRPDMYVRARMTTSEGPLLSVPESAVIFSGQRTIVLLDEGQGTFRPMLVRLGRKWLWEEKQAPSEEKALPFHRGMKRYHEVLKGLREGDRVVSSGTFLINSESQLQGALERMLAESEEKPGPVTHEGPFHDAMRKAIAAYLPIQDALARDELEHVGHLSPTVARAAREAAGKADEEPDRQVALESAEAAEALAKGGDPKAVRDRFADLSEALAIYWRRYGAGSGLKVNLAWCPMVKHHWIQEGTSIRNPYDPKTMLRCGVLKKE